MRDFARARGFKKKVEIDYIPFEDEDGKVRKGRVDIGECTVYLDKVNAVYLWEILGRAIDELTYMESDDPPRPSKLIAALYREIPSN